MHVSTIVCMCVLCARIVEIFQFFLLLCEQNNVIRDEMTTYSTKLLSQRVKTVLVCADKS